MRNHYILDGRVAVPVDDVLEWAMWYADADRSVAKDSVGGIEVSTVFLGLDHQWGSGPPLLFETMVFGGIYDESQERYSTWEEAEKGHARILENVKQSEAIRN